MSFKISRKELTIEEQKIIIHNHELGKSYSEIAIITKKSKTTKQKNKKHNENHYSLKI